MKKCCFLICLSLLTCVGMQAQERVTERPMFAVWNTNALELEKIVQNDTATIIHTKAFFTPHYWIAINKNTYLIGNNGEKYQIKATEGIPLDEHYFMPDSGEKEFRMIFPPLPDAVTEVDFSEEDVAGGWKIWGIQLRSHKAPTLTQPKIKAAAPDKNAGLPQPVFTQGKATLKGKVLGHRPGMNSSYNFYPMGCINLTEQDVKIEVADDGSFSTEVPVATVTPAVFYINDKNIQFFLAPGEETVVYLNLYELTREQSRFRKDEKAIGKRVYFDGYMAAVSNELDELRSEFNVVTNYEKVIKEANGKSMEEIRDGFLKEMKEVIPKIDACKASQASKDILKAEVTLRTLNDIYITPAIHRQVYIEANKLNEKELEEYYKQPFVIPENLYEDGFKAFTDINSHTYIYSTQYAQIINNPFITETISKATGNDKGLFFDLSNIGSILAQISDFQPATQDQIDEVAKYSSPFFAGHIIQKNEELAKILEANKKKTGFTVNEVGEVVDEDLFASLVSKFRGKVVLVDFWATWCGPCIMANKAMKPMKEELAGEDIVYLYIAGENSPQKTWENMIVDIPGEHVRVNEDQWHYLGKTFEVKGVPTYLILDKEGNVTFKQTGFAGVDVMTKELRKQLDK